MKFPFWTDGEESIVRAYYRHSGGGVCLSLLPRRSKLAIRAKAAKLGVLGDRAGKRNNNSARGKT